MLLVGAGVGELGARPGSENCDTDPFTAYCQAILDKPVSLFCVRDTLGCELREPCDDGNVCTYDYRDDGGECRSEPAPNTLECASGDMEGLCRDGECVVAAP
jgi:hypothetical protein